MDSFQTPANYLVPNSSWQDDESKNICVRIQDHIFDFVDLLPVQAGFGFAYSLVFLCGLAANCATLRCLIIFDRSSGSLSNPIGSNSNRGLRFGVSREFLISLTLADLILICCTSLPLTAVHIFTRRWLLGAYACKFGPLLQGIGCFVTSFSLMAIAIERYCLVANGNSKASKRMKRLAVITIWVLAVSASTPLAFAHVLRRECIDKVGCLCGEFCDEIGWNSETDRTRYGIAASILQYALPACVLAFCYFKVRQSVRRGVQKRLQREHVSLMNQERLSKRKTRTSNMTLFLFAGFACPWLPMCVMNLLRDFNHLPEDWYAVAFAAGHLIAMTSVLYNPIVYCWANRFFRSAFTDALFCGHVTRCFVPYTDCHSDEYGGNRCYGETATAAPTVSTLERSIRRRSDYSHQSARSTRLSSNSSGIRSRLPTVSSLGVPHAWSRSRPGSWQGDTEQTGGGMLLKAPVIRASSKVQILSTVDSSPADCVAV